MLSDPGDAGLESRIDATHDRCFQTGTVTEHAGDFHEWSRRLDPGDSQGL